MGEGLNPANSSSGYASGDDGRLFHARGAATADERSPSDDDVVRGTATEPDVAHLTPALAASYLLTHLVNSQTGIYLSVGCDGSKHCRRIGSPGDITDCTAKVKRKHGLSTDTHACTQID